MNKKIAKLVVLAAFAVGAANATEMRSPYLSERGPIRYTFEKENPDRYSLNIYSGMYTKKADKAFMKHGTDTHPLSTLFFNKANFDIKEILPNSAMPMDSEHYNPFISIGKLSPRVRYFETGVNVGGRFEYPVYKDKGRIGVRLNIPFTTIELEREDFFDKHEDPLEYYRLDKTIEMKYNDGVDKSVIATVRSYRMDLINEAWYLAATGERKKSLEFGLKPAPLSGGSVKFAGSEIAKSQINEKIFNSGLEVGLIKHEDVDTRPEHLPQTGPFLGFGAKDVVALTAGNGPTQSIDGTGVFSNMNPGGWEAAKEIGFFTGNTAAADPADYSVFSPSDEWLETKWMVFGYDENAVPQGSADTVLKGMDSWLRQYSDNPYYWFSRRDFSFETDRRTGFGDIDLDLFYEHTFSDEWVAEAMIGLKFPTGTNDDYYGNPYRVHLGNGEHWEIKLGAMGAWMPLDWMNVRLDGRFSFVLESSEQRCAGFKGAQIKNIGPQVAADVDWQYLTLNLDFTFFHPKTDDLSLDVGYEFYYKTKDDVDQKRSSMESWLGKKWAQENGAGAYGWRDNDKELDDGVLEGNTQSISHKVRCESSYRFSDWFEMYAGGSFIFAGKNIPREADLTLGMNVRY